MPKTDWCSLHLRYSTHGWTSMVCVSWYVCMFMATYIMCNVMYKVSFEVCIPTGGGRQGSGAYKT